MATYKVVMVRHGESSWNKENRFCGWFDADLADSGADEAKSAGKMLKDGGYEFDVAYTSVLKRAIKTLYFIQDELDLHWIPVERHWRLNERMYGALQGLNKSETAAKHGEDQVKIWRRSFDTPPPAVEESDERWPGHDPKYQFVDKQLIPKSECLKDTIHRVLPYWYDTIVPAIKKGQRVLIAAHGNSLRSMVKYLDNMTDEAIMALNIPTGIPLVYELDADLKPIKHYYLADEAQVKAAMDKARQRVLLVGHNHTINMLLLSALNGQTAALTNEDILDFTSIENGRPILCDLDESCQVLGFQYIDSMAI